MKISIVIVNLLLGLVITFYGVNELLHLATLATQGPDSQYYFGISLAEGFVRAVFWSALGVLSIVCALAFRKSKKWATIALPVPPLVIFLNVAYVLVSSDKSDLAWTGAILTLVAVVLLVFLIMELLYLVLRKKESTSEVV